MSAFVSRETPFKQFRARASFQCSVCRRRQDKGSEGYKPVKNIGGWMFSARICAGCGEQIATKP